MKTRLLKQLRREAAENVYITREPDKFVLRYYDFSVAESTDLPALKRECDDWRRRYILRYLTDHYNRRINY